MAIIKQNIADWEDIFLDTSVIINLLLFQKGISNDPVCLFITKLINYLSKTKRKDGKKDRTFYFSAISLSEILSDEGDKGRIPEILAVIGSKDTEIVAFDDVIALQVFREIASHLSNANLNRFAKEIGWKEHELMLAREWINRDFMIAMSGKNRNVDVLLTSDYKTFLPACDKIDAFCALTYPELFNQTEDFIFEYYTGKVADFVEDKKKSKEKRTTKSILPIKDSSS